MNGMGGIRWVMGSGFTYLAGAGADQVGRPLRVEQAIAPLASVKALLFPAQGTQTAKFLLVGLCVRADPVYSKWN